MRTWITLVGTVAIGTFTGLLGPPSLAAAGDSTPPAGDSTPAEVRRDINDVSPAILANAAPVVTSTNGDTAIATTINGSSISVPTDPADGISVDSGSGPGITIALPSATRAEDAKVVSTGVVAFDNNNGSTTVPVVKSNGSVSINTLIPGADSPTRYTYTLTIPGSAPP